MRVKKTELVPAYKVVRLDGSGPDLADGCDIDAAGKSSAEECLLTEVVAVERIVHVGEDLIVFEKWHGVACCARDVLVGQPASDVEGVAEVAGISESVAGCDRGGVRGREGREDGVAVAEIDSAAAQAEKCRCIGLVHRTAAEAIGDKEDDVVARRWLLLGIDGSRSRGCNAREGDSNGPYVHLRAGYQPEFDVDITGP